MAISTRCIRSSPQQSQTKFFHSLLWYYWRKTRVTQKFCGIVPKCEDFKDIRTVFSKKNRNSKIFVLEKNFCPKKAASWWVTTFRKKIFGSDPPKRPRGGYFKDFRLIFIILGFKGLKIGQKRKVLSQISCTWMKYNIIIQKKNRLSPQTPPGGRKLGNLREI